MSLRTWLRRHGPNIIAQAAWVPDKDLWQVSIFLVSDPAALIQTAAVEVLHSAQAKADHLARTTFKHRCTIEDCGEWTPCFASSESAHA